jgi:hypothetical protein
VLTIELASASRLVDLDTDALDDQATTSVKSVEDSFQLDKTPLAATLAAADGITIVVSGTNPTHVWIRKLIRSLNWVNQASWFLDPAAGNDENSGDVVGSPLLTLAELTRRINGASIIATTTITLAAGTYGDLTLDLSVATGVFVIVQGALTTSATGTLSAVTDSAPLAFPGVSTRGAVTNTGGDPAYVDRTRLRLTSGTNSGALAWVTRVIATDNANVSRWANANPTVTTLPTIGNAGVGNTYAVEAFASTIRRLSLRCRGQGRIVVRECTITISGTSQAHRAQNDQGTLGGVYFYSCLFSGTSVLFYDGQCLFVSCSFQATTTAFSDTYISCRANAFQGGGVTLDGDATANFSRSNCFDSCQLTLHQCWLTFTGTPADCEWSDMTVSSIICWPGSFVDNDDGGILWGANNASSTAIIVRSLAPGITPQAVNFLNIPGGVADTSIGGNLTAYGALPFYDVAHGCGIVDRV